MQKEKLYILWSKICRHHFIRAVDDSGNLQQRREKRRKVCNAIFYVMGYFDDEKEIAYHAYCSVHKLPPCRDFVEAATLSSNTNFVHIFL